MILSNHTKLNASNDVHNRIMRTDDHRQQTGELLNLFNKYGDTLADLNNLEQQIAARLRLWYTDHSSYSSTVLKLKEAIDYRAALVTEDVARFRAAVSHQNAVESETYKPLKAAVTNYMQTSKRFDHYRTKLPKLTQSTANTNNGQVSTRKIQRVQRNERKLENTRTDTEAYEQQIYGHTAALNIDRFNRINPIVKLFIAMQLRESLKDQGRFGDLANTYEQVFDMPEHDDFNNRFFEPVVGSQIRPPVNSSQYINNNGYGSQMGISPRGGMNPMQGNEFERSGVYSNVQRPDVPLNGQVPPQNMEVRSTYYQNDGNNSKLSERHEYRSVHVQ